MPLRHPRKANFSRLLSVSSLRLSTPESITPLERPAPYLLLISFSSIQFNRLMLLLLSALVNAFRVFFLFFFGNHDMTEAWRHNSLIYVGIVFCLLTICELCGILSVYVIGKNRYSFYEDQSSEYDL